MASYEANPELLALYRRATEAQMLADRGELDGEVALSYVIWPMPEMEKVSGVETRRRSGRHRQRVRGLGVMHSPITRSVG